MIDVFRFDRAGRSCQALSLPVLRWSVTPPVHASKSRDRYPFPIWRHGQNCELKGRAASSSSVQREDDSEIPTLNATPESCHRCHLSPPLIRTRVQERVTGRRALRTPASQPWTRPPLTGSSLIVGESERSAPPVIRVFMRAPCYFTPLTSRLSCLLQFPVKLRPDLCGLASHEVQRRNVAAELLY